jgi:hypothetical protein
MENKDGELVIVFFTTDENNNKIVLICNKINKNEAVNYNTILIYGEHSFFKHLATIENISDSIGTYKSTREYMISEKNFAGNSSYIFYSLALTDGLPTLNIQLIQKKQRIFESKLF